MTRVSLQQASERLGELIDAAVRGEDVIVIRDDRATVRLVALQHNDGRPRFGSAKGSITMADDFDAPLNDFREYME